MTTGKHFKCNQSVPCSSVVPYSSFPCMFGDSEREEKKQQIDIEGSCLTVSFELLK